VTADREMLPEAKKRGTFSSSRCDALGDIHRYAAASL
jgi:hypothetical protein